MKQVTVEIPDGKELIFENGEPKLVDTVDVERENILECFRRDIDMLHKKYEKRLMGKFSIKAQINFSAFHSSNRRKIEHWVDKNCSIEVIPGEKNWHD